MAVIASSFFLPIKSRPLTRSVIACVIRSDILPMAVWTSLTVLIAVTLSFLAFGYYFGGWIADRKPEITVLNLFIVLAGLATLCIPLISTAVIGACHGLGLRGGALASSLVLFSPSMFFFGAVVPFSIKLTSSDLKVLGISAGRIYAVSTLGGLSGTLLTGFFLIPIFQYLGIQIPNPIDHRLILHLFFCS